jgi:hypothetical protein
MIGGIEMARANAPARTRLKVVHRVGRTTSARAGNEYGTL